METLKIEIPKGYMIDNFDLAKGEIKFKEKPKDVMQRIKTLKDVFEDNSLDQSDFDNACEDLDPDEKSYMILKLVAKSLNEGWTPNWNNTNEAKYYPWFEMGGSSGFRYGVCAYQYSASVVGSRLCFKTRELAIHAGQNFTEVYKKFMLID